MFYAVPLQANNMIIRLMYCLCLMKIFLLKNVFNSLQPQVATTAIMLLQIFTLPKVYKELK